MEPLMAGYLYKEIESSLRWKRRWFVLHGPSKDSATCVLAYFDHETTTGTPVATALCTARVELANCKRQRPGRWPWRLNFLQPEDNSKSNSKWVLSGESRDETVAWVAALQSAGARDTFDLHALDQQHSRPFQTLNQFQPAAVLQWATKALGRQRRDSVGSADGVEATRPNETVVWRAKLQSGRSGRSLASGGPSRPPSTKDTGSLQTMWDATVSSAASGELSSSGRQRAMTADVRSRTISTASTGHVRRPPPLGTLNRTVFTSSASSALASSLKMALALRDTDTEDDSLQVDRSDGRAAHGLRASTRQRLLGLLEKDPARLEALLNSLDDALQLEPMTPSSTARRGSSERLKLSRLLSGRHHEGAPASASTSPAVRSPVPSHAPESPTKQRAATYIQRLARGRVTRSSLEGRSLANAQIALADPEAWHSSNLAPRPSTASDTSCTSEMHVRHATYRCLVLGSLNMDLRADAISSWPDNGGTTVGTFSAAPGGAGANEAVALSKLGVHTSLIGRVGTDEMGRLLVEHLDGLCIDLLDTSAIRMDDSCSTGVAVQVSSCLDGRKAHIVCQGANAVVSSPEVDAALALLPARAPSSPDSYRDSQESTQSSQRTSRADSQRMEDAGRGKTGNAGHAGEQGAPSDAGLRSKGFSGVRLVLLQLELPKKAMRRVAAEARSRGCTVALRASPLPQGVRSYQAKAEALLRGHVDIMFIDEWDAPELLGWERHHAPLLTVAHADRAAEGILLRWPTLRLVVVSSCIGHVCRERLTPASQSPTPHVSHSGESSGAVLPKVARANSFDTWATLEKQHATSYSEDLRQPIDLVAQIRVAGDAAGRPDGSLSARRASALGRERAAAENAVTLVMPRCHIGAEDVAVNDAFVAGFLAAQCRGLSASQSLLWAHAASSIATHAHAASSLEDEMHAGAHASLPTSGELITFLTRQLNGLGANDLSSELQGDRLETPDTPHEARGSDFVLPNGENGGSAHLYFSPSSTGNRNVDPSQVDRDGATGRTSSQQGSRRINRRMSAPAVVADTAEELGPTDSSQHASRPSWAALASFKSKAHVSSVPTMLKPSRYLGQNAWHVVALSASLPALSLLLSPFGGHTAMGYASLTDEQGQPDMARAFLARALQPLLEKDAFGLTPLQRAHECYRLAPTSARLLTVLKLLLAARMLLAAAVGEHLLAPKPGHLGRSSTLGPRARLSRRGSTSRSARASTVSPRSSVESADEQDWVPWDAEIASPSVFIPGSYDGHDENHEEEEEEDTDEEDLHEFSIPGLPARRASVEAAAIAAQASRHLPPAALSEAEILDDGGWIFGCVLPEAAHDAAAVVALELLCSTCDAAPELGAEQQSLLVGIATDLVVHTCLPALMDLESGDDEQAAVGGAQAAEQCVNSLDISDTQDAAACAPTSARAAFGKALLVAQASDGATLLVAAASAGAAPLVARLLDGTRRCGQEVSVSAMNEAGQTALHVAAKGCHREVCALLLARTGLALFGHHAADKFGHTPEDLCPPRFREELRELRSASEAAGGSGRVHRPIYTSGALVAGRYAVHVWVGRRVALAQDVLRHRPCALKFCETADLLEREASLLNIVGPEVVPEVYDGLYDEKGEDGKQHVLVMQAADPNYSTPSSCSELAHFCSKRREGLEARTHALRLIQCVLALHDRGLVHADLKVQHFLRFSGEWKLVDLGSVIEEGTECIPACTVKYAAPEVATALMTGTPLKVSATMDAWALGMVLYQLFAGKPLLPGDDVVSEPNVLAAIAQDSDRITVSKLRTDTVLNEPQRRLLLSMLNVDPQMRGRDQQQSEASAETRTSVLRQLLKRGFFKTGEDTEEAKNIEVLALFSSPRRVRTERGYVPIQALQLMREVVALQDGIPRRMREVRPAARFPDDIAAVVRQVQPRILQFSGHGLVAGDGSRRLAFEISDGTLQLPDPRKLVALLAGMRRLECVFLNACQTLDPGGSEKSLGERIVEALPHIVVVGWRTITEDKAAAAFSRGFYDALGRGCTGSGGGKVSIAEAYASGEALFAREGFVIGDPAKMGRSVHGVHGMVVARHRQERGKLLEKRRSASDVNEEKPSVISPRELSRTHKRTNSYPPPEVTLVHPATTASRSSMPSSLPKAAIPSNVLPPSQLARASVTTALQSGAALGIAPHKAPHR